MMVVAPPRPTYVSSTPTKGATEMSGLLTEEEIAELMPSELVQHATPIPTQIVASDEYYPDPQNAKQREVEARMLSMADEIGGRQGMDRRRFFQTAAGLRTKDLRHINGL
jgi:hypothetical protein